MEWIAGKTRQPKVKMIWWQEHLLGQGRTRGIKRQPSSRHKPSKSNEFTVQETLEYPAGTELRGERQPEAEPGAVQAVPRHENQDGILSQRPGTGSQDRYAISRDDHLLLPDTSPIHRKPWIATMPR